MNGVRTLISVACVLAASGRAIAIADDDSFVAFESGPVRPIALSADRATLYVVNAPAARVDLWDVSGPVPVRRASVPVGLEPVAVAERIPGELWVVNHLSDSVSVLDVGIPGEERVLRTIQVGDEPRDLVFAGIGRSRAFVTCARRGQNRPGDPQLTTAGAGRADVWVLDAFSIAAPSIVTLFGDTPRALATDASGSVVYAAVFHSGNQTTCVPEDVVPNGFSLAQAQPLGDGAIVPGGLPGPSTNKEGRPAPETGLIVKYETQSAKWRDQAGRDWSPAVRFDLPDHDVFAIDALAQTPVETARYDHVGTTIFGLAVNPANGRVYAANTDARNEVRFEGPGKFGGTTVRGRLAQARITVITPAAVTPFSLNPHIDYDRSPAPKSVAARTLAIPSAVAVTPDGGTLFVAALGSSKVAMLATGQLESGQGRADPDDTIAVSGGGPAGLAHDPIRGRLYVFTLFDGGISVVDVGSRREIGHFRGPAVEPPAVRFGRRFLYDSAFASSNGEASCASCHVFGDMDHLAWDLGNPDAKYELNPNPVLVDSPFDPAARHFHPMKGPMTTQSLRGMEGAGPMHWRGDRTGGARGGDPLDEHAAFTAFNPAFQGLLGRRQQLRPDEMSAFADFALALHYPPSPVANLDGTLTAAQQRGRDRYFGDPIDGVGNCDTCHVLDPAGRSFGTSGQTTFELEAQMFKVPHLRNLYQKTGMFGMPPSPFFRPGDNTHQGPQVRGFGYSHDGATDSLVRFVSTIVFDRNALNPTGFADDAERRDMVEFLLAFDTGLAPVVGQQETLTAAGGDARVDLLLARAAAGDCDVVAHGVVAGVTRGWLRQPDGNFRTDRAAEPALAAAALRALKLIPGTQLTFTAVPKGEGARLGIDRDEDGVLDGDEIDDGTDPDDAASGAAAFDCPPVGQPVVKLTRLRIADNQAHEGDETFDATLSAEAKTLNPIATGLAFEIVRGDGLVILRRVVPPRTGWRAAAGGSFVWDDPLGLAAGGITRITVGRAARSGKRKIVIRGSGDRFPAPDMDVDNTSFVLRLGGDGAPCGSVSLDGRCRRSNGVLECR